MTQSEAKELIPMHALGALDPPLAREVEAFLRQAAPEIQREAREFREVAALLPYALLSPSVSASLKDELLAGIEDAATADSTPKPTTAKIVEFRPRQKPAAQPGRYRQWLALAAAILLAAGSVFLYWQNWQLARERADLARRLDDREHELERIASPTTRVLALQGQETPQASAKVFWDTARHQWVMHVFDLPAPPADKDYQLWYVTKDAKISAAVFRTDAQGRRKLELSLPAAVAGKLAATAVTLEPKGGVSQPTGKFYLLAQI
jgi:hypothetical protein